MAQLEVIQTGTGLSIQDFGRPGWRRYGVPPGGAMDRHAAGWANRLMGNPEDAPVLEILLQGAELQVLEPMWLAIAGADLGGPVLAWTAERVAAETVLRFSGGRSGLWAYVAVPGGFDAPRWFGSASVDARNGLGRVIHRGDRLVARGHARKGEEAGVGRKYVPVSSRRSYAEPPVFPLLKGPDFARFSPEAVTDLVNRPWRVSSRSDRTGYRLDGTALSAPAAGYSEPVLPGSFQIPGNGLPIVTMRDGPTVGGYPQLALLQEADLDRFAQCRPGVEVRFQWEA